MVHCGTGPSYLTPINEAKYHDPVRGSRNYDEDGRFTYWRNCCRYEPNRGATWEPNDSTTGYQEGER